MMYFDENNLLMAQYFEEHTFNALLFTYELYLLENGQEKEAVENSLRSAISNCIKAKGIYNPTPDGEFNSKHNTHDNITAICGFSHLKGLNHHKHIWDQILVQKLRYNNITPEKPGNRFLHPRDLIYYGYLNKNLLCTLMLPLFALCCILSFFKNDTSGKLLTYVRCKSAPDSWFMQKLFKLVSLIVEKHPKFRTWNSVFSTYFAEYEHPINIIARHEEIK